MDSWTATVCLDPQVRSSIGDPTRPPSRPTPEDHLLDQRYFLARDIRPPPHRGRFFF